MIFLDGTPHECTLDFFDPGEPGRPVRMGLSPIPLEHWLIADARRDAELERKRALYGTRHEDVVSALPTSAPACEELRRLVVQSLDSAGVSVLPGHEGSAALHPIERAGRLVQEDFCLHEMRDGAYALTAASLCSPTRWRLAEKIGRSLDDIHDGVPRYADRVQRRVNAAFRALKPLRPLRRTNWSLLDDDELFQPDSRHDLDPLHEEGTLPGSVDSVWVRVEVQTLLRLLHHDAVVFTIRVFQTPLATFATRPELAARFADVLRAMPSDSAQYKGLTRAGPSIADWLSAVGSGERGWS